MDEPSPAPERDDARSPVAAWVAGVVAGLVGLWYGYEFGAELSGVWLGLVTAFGTGLIGFLIASSLVEQWVTARIRRRRGD